MFNIGRQGRVNIVNEPGLYNLIFRSDKPGAKACVAATRGTRLIPTVTVGEWRQRGRKGSNGVRTTTNGDKPGVEKWGRTGVTVKAGNLKKLRGLSLPPPRAWESQKGAYPPPPVSTFFQPSRQPCAQNEALVPY
jgi:hypothetical protein